MKLFARLSAPLRQDVPPFLPPLAAFLFFALRSSAIAPRLALFDLSSVYRIIAGPAAETFLTIVMISAVFGAGRVFPSKSLRRVFASGGAASEFVLTFGLGFGVLSALTFFLSAAGLPHKSVFTLLCAFFAALGFPRALFLIKDTARRYAASRLSVETAVLLSVILYVFLHLYIRSLTPPVDWDSLAYHLPLVKIYSARGAMVHVPWMLHSCFPLNAEMVFLAAFRAFGRDVSQLINFAVIAVCAASVHEITKKFSPKAAVAAACIFAGLGAVHNSPSAGSDFALTLFVLLSIKMYLSWRSEDSTSALAASAVFAGLAGGTKYTGLFYIAAMTAAVFTSGNLKKTALFAVAALLAAVPWYARNYIWTGNPFWPLFYGVFGGTHWSAEAAEVYFRSNTFNGLSLSLAYFLKLPVDLIIRSADYYYQPQFFVPAFLCATAAAAVKRKTPPREVLFFVAVAALNYSAWFYHQQLWRFILPSLALLSSVMAWALLSAAPAVRAALLLFCLAPVFTLDSRINILPVLGIKSPFDPSASPSERFLDVSVDSHAMVRHINANLPASSKILLFREVRGYYLDRDYQWGDPVNQALIKYGKDVADENLRESLRAHGITHVLVNENRYHSLPYYYTDEILNSMERLLKRHASPPKAINNVFLYELKPPQ